MAAAALGVLLPVVGLQECNKFRIHETVKDGDCLFDSVRQMLNSVKVHYPTNYLRRVVAESLLLPQYYGVIETWYSLYKELLKENNVRMLNEYAFLQPLSNAKDTIFSQSTIWQVSQAMMNRGLYWGEEHALRVLEDQLQIRFLIFETTSSSSTRKTLRLHYPLDHFTSSSTSTTTNKAPSHYLILYLTHNHYQPISYDHKFVFPVQDLPPTLIALTKIAAADNGWII